MNKISLWAACRQIGGYPKLISKLAKQHGIELSTKGRARYVRREDLAALRQYVTAWLNRPRVSPRRSLPGPRTVSTVRPKDR